MREIRYGLPVVDHQIVLRPDNRPFSPFYLDYTERITFDPERTPPPNPPTDGSRLLAMLSLFYSCTYKDPRDPEKELPALRQNSLLFDVTERAAFTKVLKLFKDGRFAEFDLMRADPSIVEAATSL